MPAAEPARLHPRIPAPPEPIPPEIQADVAEFQGMVEKLQSGQIDALEFRKYRLRRGIYGQRQPDVQMVRVKIPGGRLTAAQLRRLGDVAELTVRGLGHITTRQNVQYHFVKLEEVPAFMTLLGGAGLTTREACGNTVRNVVGCPLAGTGHDEVFDITPYTEAIYRHFIRNNLNQDMPRKFKFTLEGCRHDHVQTWINDVGLTARSRLVDGKTQRGFRVTLGGGLGNSPELAHLYSEFLPEDELLPLAEAVIRVFDREGNRKDKNRARLKYVVRRLGFEGFVKMVEEERAKLPAKIPIPLPKVDERHAPEPSAAVDSSPAPASPLFKEWLASNVLPQKQPGYATCFVRIPIGDLNPTQWRELARLTEQFGEGEARVTVTQNMVLRFVPVAKVGALFTELEKLGLAMPRVDSVSDIVACPGADTCNLGITSSRGLAALAGAAVEGMRDSGGATVRVSGCPNSCGQHHTAGIGFFGMSRKLGGRAAPAYQVLLGGGVGEDGARFGRMLAKIPARHAPKVIEELVKMYQEQRASPDEKFVDWSRRVDPAAAEARIKAFTLERADATDELNYVDLGDSGRFSNGVTGQGECAA